MSWGMSILRLTASSVFLAIGKAGTSDPVTAMHVSVNSLSISNVGSVLFSASSVNLLKVPVEGDPDQRSEVFLGDRRVADFDRRARRLQHILVVGSIDRGGRAGQEF